MVELVECVGCVGCDVASAVPLAGAAAGAVAPVLAGSSAEPGAGKDALFQLASVAGTVGLYSRDTPAAPLEGPSGGYCASLSVERSESDCSQHSGERSGFDFSPHFDERYESARSRDSD